VVERHLRNRMSFFTVADSMSKEFLCGADGVRWLAGKAWNPAWLGAADFRLDGWQGRAARARCRPACTRV